jgi:acyl dehydratase
MTEADLTFSSMTSADWHPIHADSEFAKGTAIGQRIFHGTFCMHVAAGMATHFPNLGKSVVGALGFREWRFLKPVFVGDTVHVEVEIAAKRPTSDGQRGVLERHIRLLKHSGEVAQEGIAVMLVERGGDTE